MTVQRTRGAQTQTNVSSQTQTPVKKFSALQGLFDRARTASQNPTSNFVAGASAVAPQPPSEDQLKVKKMLDLAATYADANYREGPNDENIFSPLYGVPNASWCASFASTMIKEAGIEGAITTGGPLVTDMILQYQANGRLHSKVESFIDFKGGGLVDGLTVDPTYVPQPGDMVFFKNNRSHVEIVEKVEGGKVYTIGGNTESEDGTGDGVVRKSYPLDSPEFTAFGQTVATVLPPNLNPPPRPRGGGMRAV